MIIDEAHTIHKPLMERLSGEWSDVRVIGLSATPFTKGLGKYYDDLVVVETTKNLIAAGNLCDYEVYSAPIDMSGVKVRLGDFVNKDAEKRVNTTKIVGDVVNTWMRLARNQKTVCFAVSVAHSKSICDEFLANGIEAAHIDAYTEPDDRKVILDGHASGKIQILVNVGITVAGWDSPDCTCLIFACPTKSLIKHIQILGRVLRVSTCGKKALILDHGGNIERNGFPTDQLPDYLDDGTSNQSESQVKEKKDPEPIACQKCRFVSTVYVCPKCGFEPEIKPKVEAMPGKLQKVDRASMEDKRDFYCMALGWAKSHGKKPGMAYYLAKDKFGVAPIKTRSATPKKPDEAFINWMTHRMIKYAKGKGKKPPQPDNKKSGDYHTRKRQGFVYKLQTTLAGERIRVEDMSGKYVCWAKYEYKTELIGNT
ncbi:MAG: ATP-dependent helicase [Gammaproteobacteria bacterium]|nr:MAG: ATP-dependent helicase [Gammaproteobacteria bacterium]